MLKLWIACLLIELDFNISFNEYTFGLLPAFYGYIIMLRIFKKYEVHSLSFKRLEVVSKLMIVIYGATFVLRILGIETFLNHPLFTQILGYMNIWVGYQIVDGISEVQSSHGYDYSLKTVYKALKIMLLTNILMSVSNPLLYESTIGVIFIFSLMFINIVISIYYIYELRKVLLQLNAVNL